ncbi:E3 ubiquitin-protein ligase [Podospora conica]|nr:E3 ubiquitin-protein ligase [Schizothecium conicum]
MFTHPAPSGLGSSVSAVTVDQTSPSLVSPASARPSRLRGLSLLRNYTQTHLLSRDHTNNTSNNTSNTQHQHHQTTTDNLSSAQPAPASSTANTNSNTTASAEQPASSFSSHSLATSSLAATTNSSARPPLTSSASLPSSSVATNPTPGSGRFSLAPAFHSPGHPLTSPSLAPPFGTRTLEATTISTSNSTSQTPASLPPPTTRPEPSAGAFPAVSTHKTDHAHAAAGLAALPTPPDDTMTRTRSATTGGHDATSNGNVNVLPSIRFSTFYDPRATRPSLTFPPISRTLPIGNETIRVGRYSERETQPTVPQSVPSAAPVGFKSKVVSRRHCEFWYEEGKWYIKDVKSSSGTFLNHIRLSPPGQESKPYPVNDGDIVQLGIDFKGGEEMIFRCVKMRLELNRGWQSKLNTFNMATHKRLRNMTATGSNAAGQSYCQDCSICLNSIAPCQCLFVAPCSHTWHYKCIRSLLASPTYPIFHCPNCRAAADLEAEVEDPEEWEQLDSDEGDRPQEGALLNARDSSENQASLAPPRMSRESVHSTSKRAQSPSQHMDVDSGGDITMMVDDSPPHTMTQRADGASLAEPGLPPRPSVSPYSTSSPMPIPTNPFINRAAPNPVPMTNGDGQRDTRTPSPTGPPAVPNGTEGPITPRNDAGPWVFDGSYEAPATASDARPGFAPRITSLEEAVTGGSVPAG